mmetsp:Transcript_12215/g.20659  ORF Transcript_12215/g.20659 Transcript_12215/m.20659 type:complete len:335 (+) Transcript_12215:157-1161(+)
MSDAAFWMGATLTTGTLSSLLMQKLTKVTGHPTAQVVTLVQYTGHFLYAASRLYMSPRKIALSTKQRNLSIIMGTCHVLGFIAAMPAIDRIGIALYQIIYSSGIVLLAFLGRVVLRKVPSLQQGLGIALVCAGLILRGYVMIEQGAVSLGGSASDTAIGVALAFFVTLCFHLPPVLMEIANKGLPNESKLTSIDVGMKVSTVGVVLLSLYVMLYTVPKWEVLMAQPLAESGTSYTTAGLWYLGNTALYIVHSTFFLETTRAAGSLGNGLVNAVRSATVVMIGAAIFCPTISNMCLDAQKLATVALLVTGGLVYTFAPPAVYLEDRKTVEEKKTK